MRKCYLLMMMPLVAMTLGSCKDNDENPVPDLSYDKLVKIVESVGVVTINFKYDNQRRITQMSKSYVEDPSNNATFYVSYGKNSFTINSGSMETVYTLDDNGYIIKDEVGDHINTYEYEGGRLVRISGSAGGSITYTWDGGNMTKMSHRNNSGELWLTETYTYGDAENKVGNLLDPSALMYVPILGKGMRSRNLPISQLSYYPRTSSTEFTPCSYTFDKDGCPIKVDYEDYLVKIAYY